MALSALPLLCVPLAPSQSGCDLSCFAGAELEVSWEDLAGVGFVLCCHFSFA